MFPDTKVTDLWAQYEVRDRVGKGPHFDLCADYVDNDQSWFGVYNLSGEAGVRTTILSPDLTKYYEENFPDISDEAYRARRELGALAFRSKNTVVLRGDIGRGSGLVLPLKANPQHVVHEVVPVNGQVGSYIKLLNPGESPNVHDALRVAGMTPFDELVTSKLNGLYTPISISSPGVIEPLEAPGVSLESGFDYRTPAEPGRDLSSHDHYADTHSPID